MSPVGARFLLIDGYNLLHAAGLARTDYRPDELRRQREKLLRLVAGPMSPAEVSRVTVIFDARDPTVDRPHTTRFAGMAVIFARPEGDADLVIARWLDRHPAPRHVTLVSGDRALQRAARGVGAQWLDSHSFLKELKARTQRRSAPEAEKPSGGLSAAEAAEWSRWFGPIDLADLVTESNPSPPGPANPSPSARPIPPVQPVPAARTETIPKASTPGGARPTPPAAPPSPSPSRRRHKGPPPGPRPRPRPVETNDSPRPDVQTQGSGDRSRAPVASSRETGGPFDLEHWMREFGALQEWVARQGRESSWWRDLEEWWGRGWWPQQRRPGPPED